MTNNSNEIIFTSLEQFKEYYKIKSTIPEIKESNQYFQTGIEAAKLAAESTLKALNLSIRTND